MVTAALQGLLRACRRWAVLCAVALGLAAWAGAPWAAAAEAAHGVSTPPTLLLHADTESVELGPWLARWVDPGGQARRDDAQQQFSRGAFRPIPGLGGASYTRDAHWYTATVARAAQAGERWVLAIGAPYLDEVQVWLQHGDGPLTHQQMGDRHLQAGRPLPGRLHALALNVPDAAAGQTMRVWLRVGSTSALNVSVELWRPDAFLAHETLVVGAWGAVLGLLLVAALTQLLFGLWLNDSHMLAFAAFIGTLFCLHLGTSGMALLLLAHPPAWYSDLIVGFGSFASVAAASIGSMLVLNIRRHLPRLRWLYLAPACAVLALLPLTVTDMYGQAAVVVNLWGLALSVFNTGVALWGWHRERNRLYGMYALATISFGAGAIVTVLTFVGVLPATPLTRVAYQVTTVVYLLIMLIAMAMRMATLRHDKLLVQQRAQEERRFAAFVAHEFRNPLASIDRSANLLQLIPDLPPDQTALRLNGMRRQVGRLTTLVDSFLNTEAGEPRPLKPRAEALALGDWLQRLREELDDDARLRLAVQADPENLQARFDAELVALALHNLIDNALRYSPEDQTVSVGAHTPDGGKTLELVVADRGPGLSSDDLQNLGRPYFRGQAALGRQGTGLGYYFCQRIALMHGGQLRAETRQPHGLAVTLRLPQRAQGRAA